MASIAKFDQWQNSAGTTHNAVVKSQVFFVPANTGSSSTAEQEVWTGTFTKLYSNSVSKLRIRFAWTFSFTGTSNGDHDTNLYLRNTTTASYLGYRSSYYSYMAGSSNSFWSQDTTNQYLNVVSNSYFGYHSFGHQMVCEDTAATTGNNTYSLRMQTSGVTAYLNNAYSPYPTFEIEEILL